MGIYLTTNEVKLLQSRRILRRVQEALHRARMDNTPHIGAMEGEVCIWLDRCASQQRLVDLERARGQQERNRSADNLIEVSAA